MTIPQIIELLDFCLNTTYLIYNEAYYQQTHGAAMGSPISPLVANCYMEQFEKVAISTAPHPLIIVVTIRGRHIHRTSRIRRGRVHWTHKQQRSTHQIHHRTWERQQTSLPGSMHPYSGWWMHEDNYLPEAETHGPVLQLQVTSPSNPQTFSCTHPHLQGTAVCHHSWRQEIRTGTRPQCPESQWIPRVGAYTSTIQCKKTT